MANGKQDGFTRGRGTYQCGICHRVTRVVKGDEDAYGCNLCQECYDVAGHENYISDHRNDGDNAVELAHAASEIKRLNALAVAKGGRL